MKQPNVVFFKYLLKDKDGNVLVDFSKRAHGEFEKSSMIPQALSSLLCNLKIGDRGVAQVPKEKGYGDYNQDLIFEIHENRLEKKVNIGEKVVVDFKNGETLEAYAIQHKTPYVVFDGNHPFAGKDVFFEVELLRRRPATQGEIDTGVVEMEC